MELPSSRQFADQSIDGGHIRMLRQPVGVKGSSQQPKGMRVRFERIEATTVLYDRRSRCGVQSEIRSDVENHRLRRQKPAEHRQKVCLHFPAEKGIDRLQRIRIYPNIFAGIEPYQSSIGARINWTCHFGFSAARLGTWR